ncbi:MAG: AAA family ATPase [Actinomycetales bacterium]|nr:AAA family ATPase [Actinomycetales bacterium]
MREHLILVGANDVGKSSLLRCLDLTLGASTAQLYARLNPSDVRDLDEPMVVEATLGDLTDAEARHFPDEVTVDPAGAPATLTVRLEVTATDEENLAIRRTAPAAGTDRLLTREQIEAIGWRMVGATQTGTRDFREDSNATLDDILARIDLGAEETSFAHLTEEFQSAISSSAVLESLRERLASQLSRATPTDVAAGDLAFTTGATSTDDLLAGVRLQVLRDGVPRNLTEQSDGARALFAIALYDLVAESANIVAVDEPEIHLHPTSQRSLANIVGRFEPEQVAVVRQGGEVVQPPTGFLGGNHKLLASWWVQSRLEPLTASQVVCVEGPSDRIVLASAAKHLGLDLDRVGVSVVELGGARAVGSIVALFGEPGFRVPLALLIDEDARQDTADVLDADPVLLEVETPYTIVVSKRDLEEEYVRALGVQATFEALEAAGFWKPVQLAALLDANSTPDEEKVITFCRHRRNKVLASIAVADALTPTTAAAISSVSELIGQVRPGA